MNAHMHGWTKKRLRVNLTTQKVNVEPLPDNYCKKWIGGRGFNSELLYHETWQGLDPYSEDNPICFAAGPLSGTFAPTSGRTVVSSRSPMTCSTMSSDIHGHGDTNMGGAFGPMMKYAGYDQIVVKGKSKKPVFLFIENDKVEFVDASNLWGLGTKQTTKIINRNIRKPNLCTTVIGPAGENLVRFACIINSYSSAGGRTGMGAVMGSKKLKAIAVSGSNPVHVAQPRKFLDKCWKLRRKIHSSKEALKHGELGSLELFDGGNSIGINAHKNCSTGYMPDLEKIYGSVKWNKKFLYGRKACWACPVACGRYTYIRDGKYAGFYGGGPEMESLCNLGARIDATDIAGVTRMCGLANDLGLDTVSAGAALSWTMEALEKGYISGLDLNDKPLNWGDIEGSMALLKKISVRKGFGDILAEGNIRAAEIIGSGKNIVPHCRGLEHVSVDPRIALGFSLGYAMSTRGSDHLKNYSCLEFPGLAVKFKETIKKVFTESSQNKFWTDFPNELSSMDTKPELCTWSEKNKCIADLCGCCCDPIASWSTAGTGIEAYLPLINDCTGSNLTEEEAFRVAERTICMERAHWLREGSGKQDDTHIDRYFNEEIKEGPFKGAVLNKHEWEQGQKEYYQLHGWDTEGFIMNKKARELEIPEIMSDMEKGKIIFNQWLNSNGLE